MGKASHKRKMWLMSQRRKLMEKQKGLCALCGTELGEDVTIDHITPRCKGGNSKIDNVQLTHDLCNCWRAAVPMEQFVKAVPNEDPEYNNIFINFIPAKIYLDGEARFMR